MNNGLKVQTNVVDLVILLKQRVKLIQFVNGTISTINVLKSMVMSMLLTSAKWPLMSVDVFNAIRIKIGLI